eukprot:12657589-Alexandrium_andersonii.AAC.1
MKRAYCRSGHAWATRVAKRSAFAPRDCVVAAPPFPNFHHRGGRWSRAGCCVIARSLCSRAPALPRRTPR